MTIYRKVQAVERVFAGLEKELASFKSATGLQCVNGCGLCCQKPDISATALEFLPLAYHLHKEGMAYDWFERLNDQKSTYCFSLSSMLTPGSLGFCSQYKYRGLICRLFGYAAMLDKYGEAKLVTCKTMKDEYPDAVEKASLHLQEGRSAPIMRNFYFQLRTIDAELGQSLVPINVAMLEAIKVVLSYYAYRRPRRA